MHPNFQDWINYLIPFLFLIVWVIIRIFGGKKQNNLPPPKDQKEEPFPIPFGELFPQESLEEISPNIQQNDTYPLYNQEDLKQKEKALLERLKELKKFPTDQVTPIKTLHPQPSPSSGKKSQPPLTLRSDVLNSLKAPHAMKKAFLAYEILGQPLSQRQNNKMGPTWEF